MHTIGFFTYKYMSTLSRKQNTNSTTHSLKEVALVFFKMGCFAFGGPAAHIAMMDDEIVTKRKWMSREQFLDLIGATNLIPGPNSTEMTMHCGYERAGKKGLFVAGICFIVPAIIITGILAYLYVTYGNLPEVKPFLFGIKPAVLAVIAAAILKLGKKALKSVALGILGTLVLIASLVGINEIIALLAAGVLGAVFFYARSKTKTTVKTLMVIPALLSLSTSVVKVLLVFLKVGAILYGSGYVLFAYLDAELVTTGLLTRTELIDAIAVGQFTPGPVLSTATFIGYQLSGFWGAIAASVGIFLPSFLFVLILNPLLPKMQESTIFRYFLDSVNIAAVAVMLAVLIVMGAETLTDWRAILIAVVSAFLMFGKFKISVMWIILGGAILGFMLFQF